MAGEVQLAVWVDQSIVEGLDYIKETKGIMIKAQVRFALLTWLESQGIKAADTPIPMEPVE